MVSCIVRGDKIIEYILTIVDDAVDAVRRINIINDETLMLYREVNLLYDLSRKLTECKERVERLNLVLVQCVVNLRAHEASWWLVNSDKLECSYSTRDKPRHTFAIGVGLIGKIIKSDRRVCSTVRLLTNGGLGRNSRNYR